MRRKPRNGPNPSPWRRASWTTACQSALTPSCSGVTRQRRSPATKMTGTRPNFRALRSSRRSAAADLMPPTSTPSMRTPAAIRPGDPAKANPSTDPVTARSRNASAPRWTRTRVEVFRLRRERAGTARESAATKARSLAPSKRKQTTGLGSAKFSLRSQRRLPCERISSIGSSRGGGWVRLLMRPRRHGGAAASTRYRDDESPRAEPLLGKKISRAITSRWICEVPS